MVEQILPTLPTKSEMSAAIAAAIALRGDTRLLADSVLSLHSKVDVLLSDRGSKTGR